MPNELSFDDLWTLTDGVATADYVDVACPLCGPKCKSSLNTRRKVLRVWGGAVDGVLTYRCARCEANGWVKRNGSSNGSAPVKRQSKPEPDRREQARGMWERSLPLERSLAAVYLKIRLCYMPCENIRFLPARNGHPPGMIARFASATGETNGIHLTRLARNGHKKADVEAPKITLGPSTGWPIIIAKRSRASLIVTEGIEDALSFALADTHATVWAAGSAGRLAPVLKHAKPFAKVMLAVDNDAAGAQALERSLKIRPDLIPVNLTTLMRSREPQDANKVLIERGIGMLKGYLDLAECQMRVDRGAA